MNNVNAKFDYFQSKLIMAFNESFPLVRKSRKRAKDKKWMSQGLRVSIRQKDRLYKKKIQSPTQHNIDRYKDYKSSVDTLIKAAETKYYQELFSEKSKSAINMWKALGSIISPGKKKSNNRITKLKIGDEWIENNREISNAMNNHFCTIGSKLASELPAGKAYHTYLKNGVNQSIFLAPIHETEITLEIDKLKTKKSPGYDDISPRLLKICKDDICKPLTTLFNNSIESATYPDKLKISKVVALYKKESHYVPDNYRPISLLTSIDKIFEKLLYKRFIKFIEKQKIIILEQYGFLRKHSTISALIDNIDNIRNYIDNGEYVLSIYLDLRKAFDTVDHKILLGKLHHYGFRGHVNDLIQSYLSDRKQYTTINGVESNMQNIPMGVPQGSVLGPFFSYIRQ